MPTVVQLRSKATGLVEPYNKIDDQLREAMGQPPDLENYLSGWPDSICWRMAFGRTWEEILSELKEYPHLVAIGQWLEERYTHHVHNEMKL